MFDFIIDQLLDILRQAIYRQARRPLPPSKARGERAEMSAHKAKAAAPARARGKRRGASPFSHPLVLGLALFVAFLVFRRMSRRS